MKCPKCGNNKDTVVDSREQREGTRIRRRRLCGNCQARWTTYEFMSYESPDELLARLKKLEGGLSRIMSDSKAALDFLRNHDSEQPILPGVQRNPPYGL